MRTIWILGFTRVMIPIMVVFVKESGYLGPDHEEDYGIYRCPTTSVKTLLPALGRGTFPRMRPNQPPPSILDRALADRAAARTERELPTELRGHKLPRVSRSMYTDHPLLRAMHDYLRDPLRGHGERQRHYTPRTIETYLDVVRLGIHHGDLTVPLRAARTTGRYRNVLKVLKLVARVASWLETTYNGADIDREFRLPIKGLLDRAGQIPEPHGGSGPRIRMTDEEWNRFLAAANGLPSPRCEALLVLFASGLRVNEWFNLTRHVVRETSSGSKVVIAEKGDWRRVWSAGAGIRPALATLASKGGWTIVRDIFGPDYSRAYATVRREIDALAEQTGIPTYSIHKFRHAFAVRARKGSTIDVVQELLGHKVINTTKIYVEEAPQDEVQRASDQAVPLGVYRKR